MLHIRRSVRSSLRNGLEGLLSPSYYKTDDGSDQDHTSDDADDDSCYCSARYTSLVLRVGAVWHRRWRCGIGSGWFGVVERRPMLGPRLCEQSLVIRDVECCSAITDILRLVAESSVGSSRIWCLREPHSVCLSVVAKEGALEESAAETPLVPTWHIEGHAWEILHTNGYHRRCECEIQKFEWDLDGNVGVVTRGRSKVKT